MNIKAAISTECQFIAAPIDTETLDETQVYVEFMYASNIKSEDTLAITQIPATYKFQYPNDGMYTYYKLLIKTNEYPVEYILGLYYDLDTDKLMFGKMVDGEYVAVEFNNDFADIINNLDTALYGIQDYIEQPAFSICELSSCLAELEKQFVRDELKKGCSKNCMSSLDPKYQRDFLLTAEYVLINLIKQERFGEATEIREALNSCNWLCDNLKSSTNSGCECKQS